MTTLSSNAPEVGTFRLLLFHLSSELFTKRAAVRDAGWWEWIRRLHRVIESALTRKFCRDFGLRPACCCCSHALLPHRQANH